jgi:hypothetical protein
MLVPHGLVGRIQPAVPGSKTLLNMIATEDLDAFLAKFVAGARVEEHARGSHPSDADEALARDLHPDPACVSRWTERGAFSTTSSSSGCCGP